MRSEDRKPSRRVFPLLQNLDLDSVTFAQLQSTGDPITIEDMNEQEMVDLIIVNLARLVVAGEWTGLLEAGGGGSNAFVTGAADMKGAIDKYNFAMTAPWADQGNVTTYTDSDAGDPIFFPFIAGNTGSIADLAVVVTSAAAATTYEFGIYSADTDNGFPDSLLGSASFDVSSTGGVTVTGLSIDITRGEPYWYAIVRDSGSNTAQFTAANVTAAPSLGNCNVEGGQTGTALKDYEHDDSLPATSATTDFKPFDAAKRPFLIMGL
jgi:hypothetical protein